MSLGLDGYVARDPEEAADVARVLALLGGDDDPWARTAPLHLTGSALVVHPPTRRVLMRWHARLGRWAQVGGHGEPGDADAWDVAKREAIEETGLADLEAWPSASGRAPLQVVIVPVPAHGGEPAHEHADVRYLLATARPEDAAPETLDAPLRWVRIDAAMDEISERNLRDLLRRAREVLDAAP